MMLSLFATGKAEHEVGTIVAGPVAIHVDKYGNRKEVNTMLQVVSKDLKRYRLYGTEHKNCLSYNEPTFFETDEEIIIPEKVSDWTITSVGEYAFNGCKAKVTLPESVTEIEDEAFLGYAYDGYDFALPSKVRYIGKRAFATSQIKGISLPSSLQNIDDYAFSSSGLEELVLPKSTFVVGNGITRVCNNLQRLEVESGCKNYSTPAGSNVIMDTKQKVVVAGCPTSKIPAEAYRIGSHAFYEIKFVNETVTIPESVGLIAEQAFYWAEFKRLIIKGETVEIGKCAFCHSTMERIDIYGGNVTIGESGFEACEELLSLWCHSHKPTLTPYKVMSDEGFWEFTGPANRQFSYIGSNAVLYAKYPEEYTDKWNDGTLIWQGWFKSVLPLPDEEKTISEIHITDFDWPVAEYDCDVAATSLTKGVTVSEIQYKMFNKNYGPKASLNDSIDVCFFITLDEGYTFGDAPSLYVDDKKFDLRIKTPSMTDNTLGFIFHYRVPAPPGGVPIKSVSITVPEPVEGQPLSTEVTRPTGKLYLVQGWTYSMVTWGHGADASTDSYDPTKAYTLAALVTAKEDYCFAADCTFKLNGKEASVIRSHNAEGREVVMLAVPYGNEEPVVPDTIVITHADLAITMPVKGETPTVEVIRPTAEALQTLGYKISYAEWIEAGKPWDSFEAATEPYDPRQTYHLVVVLTADEGNLFAENMEALINDATPQVYLGINNIGRNTATLVLEYSVRKRGDVNHDGDVNSADVVAIYAYIIEGDASGYTKEAADVDGSGDVNSADVVAVYDIIINGDKE